MKTAVVIPCYRVSKHILRLLPRIGPEVDLIYVVDDACPEKSGELVERDCRDPRVRVIKLASNQGVGGAVLAGFQAAIRDGAEILVKLDGDEQMDPSRISSLTAPLIEGRADFAKGNRFYSPESIQNMPLIRLLGNAVLSLMSKFTTGYWHIMDPTNGFIAIHAKAFSLLPLEKISKRYFFESDLVFRLALIQSVVVDVPLPAIYGSETSNLKVYREAFNFFIKHCIRIPKRLIYQYFFSDFGLASVELLLGLSLSSSGIYLGLRYYWESSMTGIATEGGKRTLVVLLMITGVQFLLAFFAADTKRRRNEPIHKIF
jgi:dolichol-phosphate mannosyltransferase